MKKASTHYLLLTCSSPASNSSPASAARYLLRIPRVNQKFVPGRHDDVTSHLDAEFRAPQKVCANSQLQSIHARIHIHCHQIVRGIQKEQFSPITPPSRVCAAIGRNLPLRSSARKCRQVNFLTPRLIILIRHPLSSKRQHRIQIIKLGRHHGERSAISKCRKRPYIRFL